MKATYGNPIIQQALGNLKGLSTAEMTRMLASGQSDEMAGRPVFSREARFEGIREGKMETARNLLAMGKISPEEIAQATGLNIEDINALNR